MHQLQRLCVAALLSIAVSAAEAARMDFSGDIAFHNDVSQFTFTLDAPFTHLKVWTDSFQDGTNFDPIVAVWRKQGDDWRLKDENDDGMVIGPGQTQYDSGLFLPTLEAGEYMFTIVAFRNWARGSLLSRGFILDDEIPVPLADWRQPANAVGMGPHWSLHIDTTPVAEPSMGVLLLGGLALSGWMARRQRPRASHRWSRQPGLPGAA